MRKIIVSTMMMAILVLFLQIIVLADNTINVTLCPNTPPYQFIDEDGELIGMHIDVMEHISRELAFEINYLIMDSDYDCQLALQDGSADMVLGVALVQNLEYDGYLTSSISTSSISAFRKLDQGSQYLMRNAAFEYNTIRTTYFNTFDISKSFVVESQQAVFEMINLDEVGVAVGVKDSLEFQMEEMGVEDDYEVISEFLGTIDYGILVAKNNTSLLTRLNNAIGNLRYGESYAVIYEKWVGEDLSLVKFIEDYLWIIGVALLVIVLYAVFNFFMNRYLKAQVQKQTQHISTVNDKLKEQMRDLEIEANLRRNILENSGSAMLVIDMNYDVLFMNNKAVQLFEFDAVEVKKSLLTTNLGKKIFSNVTNRPFGDDYEMRKQSLKTVIAKEEKVLGYSIYPILYKEQVKTVLLVIEDMTAEHSENKKILSIKSIER